MRRIADATEHLDGDLGDTATLEGNLADLARINRLFGGARLSALALRRLIAANGGPANGVLRLIDVGTGAADIPLALAGTDGAGPRVEVTAVDSRPEVLAAAARLQPAMDRRGVALALADGRALPWPDGAFDVGHTSLLLHHLDRADAVTLLGELRRVSGLGVVINDVARNRLALLGAQVLLRVMTRNHWTRHDSVLSVRRAWTHREAEALLREAGLRPIGTAMGVARHRWAIAAVPA